MFAPSLRARTTVRSRAISAALALAIAAVLSLAAPGAAVATGSATISGQVTLAWPSQLANFHVAAIGTSVGSASASSDTDDAGRFSLQVPPGTYEIRVVDGRMIGFSGPSPSITYWGESIDAPLGLGLVVAAGDTQDITIPLTVKGGVGGHFVCPCSADTGMAVYPSVERWNATTGRWQPQVVGSLPSFTWARYQTATVEPLFPGRYRLKVSGGSGAFTFRGTSQPVDVVGTDGVTAPTFTVLERAGTADFSGDIWTDTLARRSDGSLMLYPALGASNWGAARKIGSGWSTFTAVWASSDWDGDAQPDLLSRRADGSLYLYRGNGTGGWLSGSGKKIGSGWNSMTAIMSGRDFDDDGSDDVIARDSSGRLWLYDGNGTGGWTPRRQIGSGWNGFRTILSPGDVNFDGCPDLLGVTPAGAVQRYLGDCSGGFRGRPASIATGWTAFSNVVTAGDFSGDGTPDIFAVDSAGRLLDFDMTPEGTFADSGRAKQVGSGWSTLRIVG